MKIRRVLKISAGTLAGIVLLAVAWFFSIRALDNRASETMLAAPEYNTSAPIRIPALFLAGERFYLKLRLATGDTALAFGDSGGGTSMITPYAIDSFHLDDYTGRALMRGVMPLRYIPFRRLVPDERIPEPLVLNGHMLRTPFSRLRSPHLMVPPMDEELQFMTNVMRFDIFLGQNFFMNKAWTFDYPAQEVWVNTPLAPALAGAPGVLRLGFKKNAHNETEFGHPSMPVVIDGDTLDMLFDSGASMVLSDSGRRWLRTAERTIGGSFIARSVFDRWRRNHPDWTEYKRADLAGDAIQVPEITVAGHTVGPVLFAVRPDEAWSEGMIRTMDKVVKGAIGGSALKYFKVTIDYTSELIRFER